MAIIVYNKYTKDSQTFENYGGRHWVDFNDGGDGRLASDYSISFMQGRMEIAHVYGMSAYNVIYSILRKGSDEFLHLLRKKIDMELIDRENGY